MSEHTPLPWFVSGVRFRMNGGQWLSINRYDDLKKQDENIACVGYDPRNGLGQADAALIVHSVNALPALVKALEEARPYIKHMLNLSKTPSGIILRLLDDIDAALSAAAPAGEERK